MDSLGHFAAAAEIEENAEDRDQHGNQSVDERHDEALAGGNRHACHGHVRVEIFQYGLGGANRQRDDLHGRTQWHDHEMVG